MDTVSSTRGVRCVELFKGAEASLVIDDDTGNIKKN